MMKKRKGFAWILIVSAIFLLLSGCIEMGIDFNVDKDGSGKAKISIAATDAMYNDVIDDLLADTPPDASNVKIETKMVDGKKVAEVDIGFNNVAELSDYGFEVSHTVNNNIHRVEIAKIEGFPVSATLQMPGTITDSNGTVSGSTVTWPAGTMTGTYWAESEEGGGFGNMLMIIVAVVVALLIIGVVLFLVLGRKKQPVYATPGGPQGSFCQNCGNPMGPSDAFCQVCGTRR